MLSPRHADMPSTRFYYSYWGQPTDKGTGEPLPSPSLEINEDNLHMMNGITGLEVNRPQDYKCVARGLGEPPRTSVEVT